MLENFLEEYINNLYYNQNKNACLEQQNLFTKKDYYEMLRPVVKMISVHKSYTMEEMREYLFKQSHIEENVKDFVYNKQIVCGMVFSYGTRNYKETIVIGDKQEVSLDNNSKLISDSKKMKEDTIFDLASVTKIFTSLSILKLLHVGLIKLEDKITMYVPEFTNLKEVSIYDLMSFNVPLKTNGRIDDACSFEDAEKIVFSMDINKNFKYGTNPYTDMGSIALKYLIERVSGMSYYDFIDSNILFKLNMIDTYHSVPNIKLDRVASTNFETQITPQGNVNTYMNIEDGIVNDSKARILSNNGNIAGHAGLFSTVQDMTKLAKGIIDGKIVHKKYIEMMAKNRTGKQITVDEKEKYIQYLGFLCYSKNPNQVDSEVYHAMSGTTFASGGWTGTQLTVDPTNGLYFFLYGNRTHNRITKNLSPEFKNKVEIDEKGKRTIILPDGTKKIDSTRFAWDRDAAIVQPALKLAIQYKMLEDIYSYGKEREKNKQNVKRI